MGQAYRTDYTLLFIVVNRTTGNGTTQGLRNRSKKDKNLMKRYILFMVREECMTYKEVARILSISEKTVHAQMCIAIKRIGVAIQEYYNK